MGGPTDLSNVCSPTLATYLSTSKAKFISDVQQSPENGKKWTVVMGNEAGDLDSIASAVGYAWLLSEVHQKPAIPLVQIAKEDFNLRAENLYALNLAGVPDPKEYLLSTSDIEASQPYPANTFALVDHNRLGARYTTGNPEAQVISVIDHHEDEGFYKETANPRMIKPCGSCASLVAALLPSKIPAEVATLLLTAILIDTGGLKPGGKATDDDRKAASILAPESTLSISLPSGVADTSLHEIPAIKELFKQLSVKKADVSHLRGWDLLRRDYKEYSHPLLWAEGKVTIKVGLATVPVQLKAWGSDGKLETDSLAWMKERGLTALGVLTTFNGAKKAGRKGKHKRENAWIIIEEPTIKLDITALASRLWTGLEDDKTLKLKPHKKFKPKSDNILPSNAQIRVYKQKNAEATRKAVAPLVKAILEGSETPPSGPSKL